MRPQHTPDRTVRALRRPAVLGAGALALALAATACGSGSSSTSGSGATMTVLITQEAKGLDPVTTGVSSLTGGNQAAAVFDMLLWTDSTGKVQPQLAESATPSQGGKVWNLKLRPDLHFTDGTALDAEAVKFNWERHADPAAHSVQAGVVKGLTFQVLDPLTLQVTLPAANAHFDRVIAHSLAFVGSPTAIKADPQGFSAKPVGAGPYKLKTWLRDSRLTLVRNDDYWKKGDAAPKLKELDFMPVQDQGQRLNMLETGQAQLLTTANYPMVADARKGGLPVDYQEKSGGYMTMFNTSKPPFNDPRARQAFALAMDPQDRNKTVLGDSGQSLRTFLAAGSPYVDQSAVTPTANRAEAQKLLDQLAAEGKPLEFTYTTNSSPSAHKTAEYWIGQLAGLRNVTMHAEFLDGAAYIQKTQINKDFQAAEFTLAFDDPEPVLYNFLHTGGSDNRMHFSDPTADAALEAARTTTDVAARKQAYATVQHEIATQVPFFSYEKSFAAAIESKKDKISGLTVFEDGMIMFDRIGLG